jgi:SAM-dependent methyltransferase
VITPVRISAIGHGDLAFHNPIPEQAVEELLDLLALGPADRALDVGCGRGELLIRIAEGSGAGGLGIDRSDEQIARARHEVATRVPGVEMHFEARDAATLVAPAAAFALAACIGSSHALGSLDETLARLTELVRPGGYLLVGEGYWLRKPAPEELEPLGAAESDLGSFANLLSVGESYGLAPVHVAVATPRDWDSYEWAYVFNLDRYAAGHPDEEGIELVRQRADAMRRRRLLAAERGEMLGFALVTWRR